MGAEAGPCSLPAPGEDGGGGPAAGLQGARGTPASWSCQALALARPGWRHLPGYLAAWTLQTAPQPPPPPHLTLKSQKEALAQPASPPPASSFLLPPASLVPASWVASCPPAWALLTTAFGHLSPFPRVPLQPLPWGTRLSAVCFPGTVLGPPRARRGW